MSQPPYPQPDQPQPYGQGGWQQSQQPAYGQQQPPTGYGQQYTPGQQAAPSASYGAYGATSYTTPSYGAAGGTSTANLASWGQRVGAYLLDMVITGVPTAVIYAIGFGIVMAGAPKTDRYGYAVEGTGNGGLAALGGLVIFVGWLIGLGLAIWNRWINGGKGQSWGKKKMGLWLVKADTGQPIGAGMAFVRDLAHMLDSFACSIGWLFPLWDEKRQTFSDKVVGTLVTTTAPHTGAAATYGQQNDGQQASYGQQQYGQQQYGQAPGQYGQYPGQGR